MPSSLFDMITACWVESVPMNVLLPFQLTLAFAMIDLLENLPDYTEG
jgi:hypothetical protein